MTVAAFSWRAVHCKCLQGFTGWLRGFSAISAGKTCNICRDFPAICKYYRVFPADIAEKTLNHPVNPCKHLQCTPQIKLDFKNTNLNYLYRIWGLSGKKEKNKTNVVQVQEIYSCIKDTYTVAVASWSIANNFVIDFYCRCLEILRQIE